MAEINNQTIDITEVDINDAKYFSNSILEDNSRKKAFISSLGANVGFKFLADLGITATNEKSLYTSKNILKDLEISDLTIGNTRIDTRIVFNENEIFLPKKQFEYGAISDIYLFFKASKNLSSAEFLGFIFPDEINFENENKDYYFVEREFLHNSNELVDVLSKELVKSPIEISDEDLISAKNMLVKFVDGTILNRDKKLVYSLLINNQYFFNQLMDLESFEVLSNQLVNNSEIFTPTFPKVEDSDVLYEKPEMEDASLEELANSTAENFVEEYKSENETEEQEEDLPVPSLFEESEEVENEASKVEDHIEFPEDIDSSKIDLEPQLEYTPPVDVKIDDLEPLNKNEQVMTEDETEVYTKNENDSEDGENASFTLGDETNLEDETSKELEKKFEVPNIDLENIEFEDEPILKEAPLSAQNNNVEKLYERVMPNDRASEKSSKNVLTKIFVTLFLIILLLLGVFIIYANQLISKLDTQNFRELIREAKIHLQNLEVFLPESKDQNKVQNEAKKPVTVSTQPYNHQSLEMNTYQKPNQRIKSLEWEIPQNLENNTEIINYLQIIGKTLKLSLQNDLLIVPNKTELSNMVLNIRFSDIGSIKHIKIVTSSGIPKVDEIVLQSVKATIQYVNPLSEVLQDKYSDLTLIINF